MDELFDLRCLQQVWYLFISLLRWNVAQGFFCGGAHMTIGARNSWSCRHSPTGLTQVPSNKLGPAEAGKVLGEPAPWVQVMPTYVCRIGFWYYIVGKIYRILLQVSYFIIYCVFVSSHFSKVIWSVSWYAWFLKNIFWILLPEVYKSAFYPCINNY